MTMTLRNCWVKAREQYANFLENQAVDILAEAGELLWESLKAYLEQETNKKTNNFQTLTKTAACMGKGSTNSSFIVTIFIHGTLVLECQMTSRQKRSFTWNPQSLLKK